MTPRGGLVVVLTDFGTVDGYAAAVKGVVVARAPGVQVMDGSHEIPRGDIVAGARALARYWRRLPAHTVHLCVVDPGVGTARRPIAVASEDRFAVGPDNGLLTPLLTGCDPVRCVRIDEVPSTGRISPTFHGRDLFAPAAAHLASGGTLDGLGPEIVDPVLLPAPPDPVGGPGCGRGVVVSVDRFGNLETNIPGHWLSGASMVEVGRHAVVPVARSYGDVAPGEGLALVGSDGWIEVAVRDGSAARLFGAGAGTRIGVVPDNA